jgi:hypothetical protein
MAKEAVALSNPDQWGSQFACSLVWMGERLDWMAP